MARVPERYLSAACNTLVNSTILHHFPMPSNRASASSKADPSAKEPLFGFLPRRVKGEQVRKALVSRPLRVTSRQGIFETIIRKEHDINPFTKEPHTSQYRNILKTRKKLPVFAQMDDFYKMVCVYVLLPSRISPSFSLLLSKDTFQLIITVKFSANQIMIVVGETGCGKTTQYVLFPSICL